VKGGAERTHREPESARVSNILSPLALARLTETEPATRILPLFFPSIFCPVPPIKLKERMKEETRSPSISDRKKSRQKAGEPQREDHLCPASFSGHLRIEKIERIDAFVRAANRIVC
jgi:hypothetical protein